MRNYIQRFKSFFRGLVTGGRQQVVVKGGADLVLADGARLYLEGAAGDTWITKDGAALELVINNEVALGLTTGAAILSNHTHPVSDGSRALGLATNRWGNGLFGVEVGYHNGTDFVNSWDNVGAKIQGLVAAVIHSGDFVEAGVDGTHAFMLPNMTTTERNALTPVNGMIIYETTVNEIQAYVGSAWVHVTTGAAGS